MTRDEKKAKDRWEYVSDRLCNSDYPIYNEEHELDSAFDAGVKWADSHPNWVSVEDEPPPTYNKNGNTNFVFVCKEGCLDIGVAHYEHATKEWILDFGRCHIFTHWMPLPAPPKEGGEQ